MESRHHEQGYDSSSAATRARADLLSTMLLCDRGGAAGKVREFPSKSGGKGEGRGAIGSCAQRFSSAARSAKGPGSSGVQDPRARSRAKEAMREAFGSENDCWGRKI